MGKRSLGGSRDPTVGGLRLLIDRLRAKLVTVDDCWEFAGCRIDGGYGRIRDDDGRLMLAHVAMYEAIVGPVPGGLELDHLCRNPPCCRPDHLEPVTHAENVRRGESLTNTNAAKEACPKGHPYDWVDGGARRCRQCRNERKRSARRAREALASAGTQPWAGSGC
jgi:hypothetical protein